MNNAEIRKALKDAGMRQWELAELLGTNEFSLSRKLRKELPDEERIRILQVINDAKKEGEKNYE